MQHFILMLAMILSGATGYAAAAKIPKGYRAWIHSKSMVIPDKSHGLYGFHNIYANKSAAKVLWSKGNKKYPDGATFVVPFYDVVDKDGTVNQGKKLMTAVMMKSSKSKSTKATGGWQFAAFDGAGKPKAINAAKDCFGCHAPAKASDHVLHKFIP